MTLKETFNIINKLKNELDLELTKKKINFDKTQPKASRVQEVIVNKSNAIFDTFTTYMIKDEECDSKILSLQSRLLAHQTYLLKEIKRMKQYDDISLIVFLKEEMCWNWKEIDKELNYAEDTSRTKYKRFKKEQKS